MVKSKFQDIAILDIGSSKISCLVATRSSVGDLRVVGYGNQLSQGIGRNAVISDVVALEKAIVRAVSVTEKNAKRSIDKVFVNISGNMLESKIQVIEFDISNGEVKEQDLVKIKRDAYYRYSTNDIEVIQAIPVNYEIDGIPGIGNPSHMYGQRLKAYLNIVTISRTAKRNLLHCLSRSHLNVLGIIPSAYASSIACISREEAIGGAVLIDIGDKNTDIAIYLDGKMHYICSIPIGGSLITRDIQQLFSLSSQDAERLKVIYGSVFPDNRDKKANMDLFDTISDEAFGNYIQKHKLSEIIYERVREIFIFVQKYVTADPDVAKLFRRAKLSVSITGGTANLVGIEQLAQNIFKTRVIVKAPKDFSNIIDAHNDPSYATLYGMLKIAEQYHHANLHELVLFEEELNLFKFIKENVIKTKFYSVIDKYF
ncbi:MAG: cell division protein FtsA [Rickettsiales bacterium]|nr:cell division protein FtsA [Rickettsiales bacterium]